MDFSILEIDNLAIVNLSEDKVKVLRKYQDGYKILATLSPCDSRLSPWTYEEEEIYFDRSCMERVVNRETRVRIPLLTLKTIFNGSLKIKNIIVEDRIYKLMKDSTQEKPAIWDYVVTTSCLSFKSPDNENNLIPDYKYFIVETI